MRPSVILQARREAVIASVHRHRAANPRVFGSIARGDDADSSDIDLLVDREPGATLFDLGALQDELEALLACRVDVLTPADLPAALRTRLMADSRAL